MEIQENSGSELVHHTHHQFRESCDSHGESLSNMVESLKKTEMEETDEMELFKSRMEEFERHGRKRQELLEHIANGAKKNRFMMH